MRAKVGGTIVVFLVGIVTWVHATVLFEDNFDTKDNWVLTIGTPTENVAGGWYTVTNNTGSIALIKHSEVFSTFTYTVKLKVESQINQGCGILFNMQDNLASYMFSIMTNQQYYFGKWVVSGQTVSFNTLAVNWSSHIYEGDNTLTISKSGGNINLFVNNVFLQQVSESSVADGAIGLGVGAGEIIAFDYACVTDDVLGGERPTWFSDDFEDNNLNGWRNLMPVGSSTTESEGGVLKVSAVDSTIMLYTDGSYKDVPCTTVVTHTSGSATGLYGIIFMTVQPSQAIVAYQYFINGGKNYFVCASNQSGTIKANSNIHGTTDTLIVTKDYDFIVNGHKIDSTTFTQGLDFNAVGIHVDAGVSVEFDNFRAGDNPGTPIIHTPSNGRYANSKPSYILGGAGIIYNTRGRKVATFENGYKEKLKNLSPGPYYIVIPNHGKNHVIRRAVINNP